MKNRKRMIVIGIAALLGILLGAAWLFRRVPPMYDFSLSIPQAAISRRTIEKTEDVQCVAQTAWGEMWLRPSDGNFYVDLSDGSRWWGAPENALEDTIARGVYKMELNSALVVEYVNLPASNTVKKNSYATCVQKDAFQLYQIDGGFRAEYTFDEPQITVPLEVTLEADHLQMRVVTADIQENHPEQYLLESLWLYPNFGAAKTGEMGYILVPDGSGALMYFDNQKYNLTDYSAPVYGADLSIRTTYLPARSETASLPVYGMKKGEHAFLAVIAQGDGAASLHALTHLRNSSYSSAYASFQLRTEDKFTFDNESNTAQTVKEYQTECMEAACCQVDVYFLAGEDADYNGMAARYRKYLMEKYQLQEEEGNISLLVDYYVAVKRNQPLLGIPLMRTGVLSSLTEIGASYDALRQGAEGQIALRLLSWTEDQLNGTPDWAFSLTGQAGSLTQMAALNEAMRRHGDFLSAGVDLVSYSRAGHGANAYSHAAFGLSNSPAYQYSFRYSTRTEDKDIPAGLLLSPRYYLFALETLKTNLPDLKTISSLSPYTLGNRRYSSFSHPVTTGQEQIRAAENVLQSLSAEYDLILDQAQSYAFPYARVIADAPVTSSRFDTMDAEIPFYQLVCGGLAGYVTEQVNTGVFPAQFYLLKAIETGAGLHYGLICRGGEELINTALDRLFSAEQSVWLPEILRQNEQLTLARAATENTRLTRHEWLADGVALCTFANGMRILINYTNTAYEGPFGTAEAMNFLVEGGREK